MSPITRRRGFLTTPIVHSDFPGFLSSNEPENRRLEKAAKGFRRDRPAAKDKRYGIVLPEVIVVVLVASLILIVIASSIRAIMLHSISLTYHAEINAQGKKTLTAFTDDVRVATDIIVLDSDELLLEISLDPAKSDLVEYNYDANKQTLVRTIYVNTLNEEDILLMNGLKSFSFTYYTIVGDVTTKAIETKKIRLHAELTRGSGLETVINREIATQVVMRNRKVHN